MNATRRIIGLGATLFVLLPAQLTGQTALDTRLSVDFLEASPKSTFTSIAAGVGSGLDVVIDPSVTKPVTIALREVTIRTAMTAMCESIGCQWRIDGSKLVISAAPSRPGSAAPPSSNSLETIRALNAALEDPLPANTRFTGMPLSKVLSEVGTLAGLLIERAGPSSDDPKVTIDGSTRSVKETIWRGCRAAGLNSLTFTIRYRTEEAEKTPIEKALASGRAVAVKFTCGAGAPSAHATNIGYPNYLNSFYNGAKATRLLTIKTRLGQELATLTVPAGIEVSVHLLRGEYISSATMDGEHVFRGTVTIRTLPRADLVEGGLLAQMMKAPLQMDIQDVEVTLATVR